MVANDEVLLDPRTAARAARLRYVSDEQPGFGRRRRGTGFTYLDVDGRTIREAAVRARIEGLVIPPAWTEVWICPHERGHIQATGRDEAGRKQYLYHPLWREVRDQAKFASMVSFGEGLPAIRRALRRDMVGGAPTKRTVVAAIVRLLDRTLVRVGNAAYAKANKSYGLTTLRRKHVALAGDEIEFAFRGKGGGKVEVSVRDEELARVVRDCHELPGYELFRYRDDCGDVRTVDSSDVNDYLRDVTGRDVTAKSFRTWGATVLTAEHLVRAGEGTSTTARRRLIVGAVKATAALLGNTPAVCRRSYVHPIVLETFDRGEFLDAFGDALARARRSRPRELRLHEAATLDFLRTSTDGAAAGAAASVTVKAAAAAAAAGAEAGAGANAGAGAAERRAA